MILGSGTGLPNPKRAVPGYLLKIENMNILIDSGAGTLHRLVRCGVTYHDIDYILYSHLHPDHTLDLVSVLFASRNPENAREKDLAVIGPEGLEGFYDKLLSLYGATIAPESYMVRLREITDGEIDLDMCKVRAKRVEHTERSIGFRIELANGTSFAYSGDTGYCDNIVSLAKNVDLLLLECSGPNGFKATKGHLTPSAAGRIASEAGCKRLVLSHFYPVCDRHPIQRQTKEHFNGKTIIAKDNMRLKF